MLVLRAGHLIGDGLVVVVVMGVSGQAGCRRGELVLGVEAA